MTNKLKISFTPSDRSVYVLPGTTLMEAATRAGIRLQAVCGGGGTCGKCVVRILSGNCPATDTEVGALGKTRIDGGYRLACHAEISGPLTVAVPEDSLDNDNARFLVGNHLRENLAAQTEPAIRKTFRKLPPPRQGDSISDESRLLQGMQAGRIRIEALRTLPSVLRHSDFKATVVQAGEEIIAVEPGDTTGVCNGMAFDIGSTTLVGALVDLHSARETAVTARMNSQSRFGDDVLARIRLCRSERNGAQRLRDTVLQDINRMIAELLEVGNASPENVYRVSLAGNTTMQQLLCGIDPSALGELPFTPAFNQGLEMDARAIGLNLPPACGVFVFPQIGGFVGGDTVAGVLATGLDMLEGPSLLVDIGTNGEIVLAHDGNLTATSVAAGPAFEGARIVDGMRATSGAIEKIALDASGNLSLHVIGNRPAIGFCGSALIDAVAELLRGGIIDMTGRILTQDELGSDTPEALRNRICEGAKGEPAFMLAHESEDRQPVCLHQKDVRELQLANAAVRAGINLLLSHAGLKADELSSVMLAGAFGNYIRRHNALRIGMLPPLPHDRIRFVGNAALVGARLALVSQDGKKAAQNIQHKTRHIDLSMDPQFQAQFGEAMLFPESDPYPVKMV